MKPQLSEHAIDERRNLNGQRIGRKGQQTMQRLIDAATDLLKTKGLRDLSVAELARSAGTSSATFYVYFAGVPELVLEALRTAPQHDDELLELASSDWQQDPAQMADRFVRRYIELWQVHRTLYMVRNLAADEGDFRFVDSRRRSARPVLAALSENVARSKARKLIQTDVSDFAVAASIVTMLERISALLPVMPEDGEIEPGELSSAAIFASMRILGY